MVLPARNFLSGRDFRVSSQSKRVARAVNARWRRGPARGPVAWGVRACLARLGRRRHLKIFNGHD